MQPALPRCPWSPSTEEEEKESTKRDKRKAAADTGEKEQEETLSEYELLRIKNMERNKAIMVGLGIEFSRTPARPRGAGAARPSAPVTNPDGIGAP